MKTREIILDATLVLTGVGIVIYGLFFAENYAALIMHPYPW